MVDVVGTDEFEVWFDGLDEADKKTVVHVVDMLEEAGLSLGYPHSSQIKGSQYPLRELRPKRGRSPLRVFYIFDPARQAVLLVGGSKAGDNTFYESMITVSESIWEQYLRERKAERSKEEGKK